MAKRKKSVRKKRSAKQLRRDRCMKTQPAIEKKKLLKKPSNKRLTPKKLHQKAFGNAMKVCSNK